MSELIYTADIALDRTGFDIVINGIPAEHAKSTHRIRMPINEYIRKGDNSIRIQPSVWGSNADSESAGTLSITVTCDTIVNQVIVDSKVLISENVEFERFPSIVEPIFQGSFASELGQGLDLSGFTPIGPAEQELIRNRLTQLSEALANQDSEALLAALGPYFDRYESAYAHIEKGEMTESYARMLRGMADAGVTVSFDPVLQPCADGMLVDCLGPQGAAIRAVGGGFPAYDFWLVMGCHHGKAVVVA